MHTMYGMVVDMEAKDTKKTADRVRETVATYIAEARRSGQKEVTIRAGSIVRDLGLQNRTPSVCAAMASKELLVENHVRLERRVGPPSGQSTSMLYTYRLDEVGEPRSPDLSAFLTLRGIGKETYAALGGGEAFLKNEREEFGGV